MHSEADSDGEHRARKWTERRRKSPVKWERNHEIRNRENRRGTRHERVELERGIITRATYGGTESRFTDGSVVVFFLFFFMSSFCNWLRAHAIFCQPSKLAQQTLRMV